MNCFEVMLGSLFPLTHASTTPTSSLNLMIPGGDKSFANYMGVKREDFEATWSKQMSANTVTSMINGLHSVGVLNRNRFKGERGLACAAGDENDRRRAIARAKETLAHVRTWLWAVRRDGKRTGESINRAIVLFLCCRFCFISCSFLVCRCHSLPVPKGFTFVGVVEQYVASLWLLQKVFGWGEVRSTR